jgi:hypothetical protein
VPPSPRVSLCAHSLWAYIHRLHQLNTQTLSTTIHATARPRTTNATTPPSTFSRHHLHLPFPWLHMQYMVNKTPRKKQLRTTHSRARFCARPATHGRSDQKDACYWHAHAGRRGRRRRRRAAATGGETSAPHRSRRDTADHWSSSSAPRPAPRAACKIDARRSQTPWSAPRRSRTAR